MWTKKPKRFGLRLLLKIIIGKAVIVIKYWSMDETQADSTQKSINRRSTRGGKGPDTHNGGSITFKKHERKMTKEAGGVAPDWLEVMEATHTNKKTGQIQDMVVAERIEKIKIRKMERLTQLSEDGSPIVDIPRPEVNQMCLEEIPLTKGRRPGLGNLPSGGGNVSSVFPRDNELVQQVQDLNRLLKEKDATVEELKQENIQIKEQFSQTQTTLSQLQSFISSQFPGQFPPPNSS